VPKNSSQRGVAGEDVAHIRRQSRDRHPDPLPMPTKPIW
jgi:hypothetical protein